MGGSFNPVHYGHLKVASDAKRRLALDAMCIMPAAQSPLKTQHSVSVQHRLAMLDLALTEFPDLQLDTRELEEGPSYTVDSLQELRREMGSDATIYFLIGDDLLPTLNQWSRWEALTDYAHLIVANRPGEFWRFQPTWLPGGMIVKRPWVNFRRFPRDVYRGSNVHWLMSHHQKYGSH